MALWADDPGEALLLSHADEGIKQLDRENKVKGRRNQFAMRRLHRWFAVWKANPPPAKNLDHLESLRHDRRLAADWLILHAARAALRGENFYAMRAADLLASLKPNDPENLYDLAHCYSLCARGAAGPSPAAALWAINFRKRTIDALVQALDRGYTNIADVLFDPDLTEVRRSPDYLRRVVEPREPPTAPEPPPKSAQ